MPATDDRDIWIERDGDTVRQVLHLTRPFMDADAASPEELAAFYVQEHAALFGVDPSGIPSRRAGFGARLQRWLRAVPLLRRLLASRPMGGVRLGPPRRVTVPDGSAVAIVFQQLQRVHVGGVGPLDFPVWEAGIRVMVAVAPLRVVAAYSTLRGKRPSILRSAPVPTTAMDAAQQFRIDLPTVIGLFVYDAPPPSARRVEAFHRTVAESTSARKRRAALAIET